MNELLKNTEKGNLESVFITGCGYVGSALAEQLLYRGVKVGALTRNQAQAEALAQLGLREVLVDDLDSRNWHNKLKDAYKMVVNCVSSADSSLAGYQKSYLEGQRSLLEWARLAQPETICYTSSTSVYPHNDGGWVDETTPTEPSTERIEILLQAERMLLEDKKFGGKAFVLRLGGIYGPDRHFLIDQIKGGASVLPGEGKHHMNLIHRNDAVNGIIAVLEASSRNKTDIFNLCDSQPSTQREIVNWIASELQLSHPTFDPKKKSPRMQRNKGALPDRKISNKKIIKNTDIKLKYINYKKGYRAFL